MIRILRFGCLLALAQVIFGVILFFIEQWTMNVSNFEIARSITLTSVVYFSFTLLEMSITNALKDKDSSYFIGVNLGFSLLRMILTIVILFICKRNDSFDFALIFINLAAFYILTLAFSAWHRTKLSTK
ncbi:hypothetical protein [Alloprevotella sp. oral taxon 473]|uniref:hypothetical protein n=1 Tax=Alloprevotella sp. oral taxon 473 TaxID=712469 RepID=UPI0002A22C38|nr:hypothetical protein [Alloprevotella sp. oral taxon 473]EKX88375.1 hypothetical protein HMPREF9999_01921 [Alloprevotella sp. oral taxon 473 str. F0040]